MAMTQKSMFNDYLPVKTKVEKPEVEKPQRNQVDRELAKRRYYLHRQLTDLYDIDIDGAKRTINISPYKTFEEIPVGPRWYIGQFLQLGYNIQFNIIMQDTKKEAAIRELLAGMGYQVKHVWFIGLVGWSVEITIIEDGDNYDEQIFLGSKYERAIENIKTDNTEPKLSSFLQAD